MTHTHLNQQNLSSKKKFVYFGRKNFTDWNKLFILNENTASAKLSTAFILLVQTFVKLFKWSQETQREKKMNKSKIPCFVINALSKLENSFTFPCWIVNLNTHFNIYKWKVSRIKWKYKPKRWVWITIVDIFFFWY